MSLIFIARVNPPDDDFSFLEERLLNPTQVLGYSIHTMEHNQLPYRYSPFFVFTIIVLELIQRIYLCSYLTYVLAIRMFVSACLGT